jgi:hypothetical protein
MLNTIKIPYKIIEMWKLIAKEALSNAVISTRVVKKLCFKTDNLI